MNISWYIKKFSIHCSGFNKTTKQVPCKKRVRKTTAVESLKGDNEKHDRNSKNGDEVCLKYRHWTKRIWK